MKFKEEQTETKLRGGYYTPLELAAFLSKWAIKSDTQNVLEPSCGDGIFFDALSIIDQSNLRSVIGFEIDHLEANKALLKLKKLSKNIEKNIYTKDFLYWFILNFRAKKFDAVIGNPPFIRYQFLEDETQNYAETIFKLFNLPFTKHTNIWVPFVIASIASLKPGGRLAMVVPSELLHVMHAQSLRNFLKKECEKILIFDPEELWFSNTLQGAILLLAQKKQSGYSNFYGISIKKIKGNSFLEKDPNNIFESADFRNGKSLDGKWLNAFLTYNELNIIQELKNRKDIFVFKDIAKVDVGIVTGANNFFLVNDSILEKYNLVDYAHPMFGRSDHCPGVIYDQNQHNENKKNNLPTNFLWFQEEDLYKYSEKTRQYLLKGITENLHKRYKCRIRKPWFKVPSVYSTAIGMLKRAHDFPRLIYNELKSYTTDTAYRIKEIEIEPQKLVYCFINSLTALMAELEGRHYGGGVLELVPSEIEKLLVPIPLEVDFDLIDLNSKFKNSVNSELILQEQDFLIFNKMGLNNQIQQDLYNAWFKLRNRRQRKN